MSISCSVWFIVKKKLKKSEWKLFLFPFFSKVHCIRMFFHSYVTKASITDSRRRDETEKRNKKEMIWNWKHVEQVCNPPWSYWDWIKLYGHFLKTLCVAGLLGASQPSCLSGRGGRRAATTGGFIQTHTHTHTHTHTQPLQFKLVSKLKSEQNQVLNSHSWMNVYFRKYPHTLTLSDVISLLHVALST